MTTTESLVAASPAGSAASRLKWICLAVVLLAEVMDLMDSTIVTIASPAIRADIGGSTAVLQWFTAAYSLAFAVLLVVGGRLGDIFGRRRMFVIGVAGFTALSLLCALAQSPGQLVTTRLIQGAFAALLIPQGFGVIKEVFPPDEIGKAFALFGPVLGLSAVIAPVLGGLLVQANLFGTHWRAIFLINVPIGLLALAGALRFLPRSPTRHGARLDWGGMAILTVAAFSLIYPLVEGREHGWPAWCFAMMGASVALFGLFAVYERRRTGWHLIEPTLLRNRGFTAGLIVATTFFAAMSGLMLAVTLFLQLGLHFSVIRAGVTLAPLPFGIALAAPFSFSLVQKLGRTEIFIGVAAQLVGWGTLAATILHLGQTTTSWSLAPGLAISGIGMGFIFAPLFDVILASVTDEEVGSASGVLNAIQQYGGAFGVAVLGTVFLDALDGGKASSTAASHAVYGAMVLLVITFATTFLLPKKARADAAH